MPVTISHVLSATTPDNTQYEIRPSHWNSSHLATFLAQGQEIVGAFSNANGVSFGLFGTAVTASISPTAQSTQTQPAGNIAGQGFTGTNATGTLNSNGLALSVNVGGAGMVISAAGSSVSQGTVVFSNSNGVSFGMAGSVVTGTVVTNYMASNQSSNFAGIGETVGTTTGTDLALTVNTVGVSVGYPKWITTAAQSSASNVSAVIAATNSTGGGTATLSGGISFSNANGVSFYTSAGNAIVGSVAAGGVTTAGVYAASNTTGTTSSTYPLSSLIFAGAGIVSVGNSGGTIMISAPASTSFAQLSVGNSTGGNLAGNSGVVTGQLVLAGGNNITLSGSTNAGSMTISISGPNAGGAQTGISSIAAGGTTYTSGSVQFVNSNNFSFLSTTGQGFVGSFSTSQSVQTQASGNIPRSGFTTNATAGILLVGTHDTAGLNLGVPAWITTWTAPGAYVSSVNGSSGAISFVTGSSLSASSNASTITIGLASNITTALQSANANYLTSQSNQAWSGSNASSAFQTLNFGNANGISWSNNAGSVNITHDLQYTSATSAITSNALNTSASRVFNVVAATNNTGGGTASLSSNVSFSNANGLTFYTSAGNAVVASYTVPSQSVQTQASGNIPRTGFSTTSTAGALLVGTHDTNGLSLGVPAWLTVAGGVQTAISGIVVSNTTYTSGTVSFSNANGISFGSSAGQAITASYTVPAAQTGISGIQVSNTTYTSGTVVWANSNGISFGSSGAQSITASYTVPSIAGLISAVNISASGGNSNLSNFSFGTSPTVTFGLNGSTITASAVGGGGGINIAASNTTFTSGTVVMSASGGAITINSGAQSVGFSVPQTSSLSATGIVSISTNASTISIGVPAMTVSNSAGSFTANAINFSNANNVTWGTSAGSIITASVNAGGGGINIAASNTTFTSGTVVMSAAGGAITIGSGAQSVNFSVPATSSLSATGIVSLSTNGSTVSVGVPALTISNSAGSFTASQVLFSNANNITWGTSAGNIVTASVLAQTNQSLSFLGVGNTTSSTASGTLDARSLYLSGAGAMSVGFSNSTIVLSVPVIATTASYYALGNTTGQSSNSLINDQTVSFSGLGIVSAGLSAGAIVISATQSNQAFSASNASSTFQTLSFLNASNISWSNNAGSLQISHSLAGQGTTVTGLASITLGTAGMSFNGSNLVGTGTGTGSTTGALGLSLNSAGFTISQPYRTRYIYPDGNNLSSIGQFGNATMSINYIDIMAPITGTRLDALASMSFSTTAGAGTQTYNLSAYAVIYSKNVSTLSSLSSGSTQTTYTLASNTAGQTQLTQPAIRPISVPINFNMVPGEYFVGFNFITANTAGSATFSIMGDVMQAGQNFAEMTAQTATSTGYIGGMGIYSVATTGTIANVSLTAINQTGTALAQANIALIFRNG